MKPHIARLTATPRACDPALEFAGRYDTMVDTIAACGRPDWLRWVLCKLPAKERVRHACIIVRDTPVGDGKTTWDMLTDDRSRQAILTGLRWADGAATDEERRKADADAADAAAADAAAGEWQIHYITTQIDWSFMDQPLESKQ